MKLPEFRLTRTRSLLLAAAAILFVAWRVYAALFPTLGEERKDPVVRTVTIGTTATEDAAVYPGEVRGKYESSLAFQTAGKSSPATSTSVTRSTPARSCSNWTRRTCSSPCSPPRLRTSRPCRTTSWPKTITGALPPFFPRRREHHDAGPVPHAV